MTLPATRRQQMSLSYVQASDRDKVLQFCRAAHNESIFKDIPFSERKFDKLFQEVMRNPERHLGLKAQLCDQILGVLHCSLGGYFVGDGARVASVTMLNIDKNVRSTVLGGKAALRLVRELEKWARSKSADYVLFYVTSGETLPKTDRFFRKLGMTTLGGNYGKKIVQ